MIVRQYEVFIVNLDPTIGSEIKKTRPCAVISPDEMNKYLDTVVIAPITSQSKKYPTRAMIDLEGTKNWVVIDQLRTIDKTRLIRRVGELTIREINCIKLIIKETFVD
ncbi:MAG: type II toxin-antitoxin system PemK/MazF family toxin [Bacteroidales bacterium]